MMNLARDLLTEFEVSMDSQGMEVGYAHEIGDKWESRVIGLCEVT